MDYKDHIDNLTQEQVESAQKALDYLDGYQLTHLEEFLNHEKKGVKDWEERGVVPVYENLTRKVIERSALVYQIQPERKVVSMSGDEIEAASELYEELLEESNFASITEDVDQVARLLKVSLLMVQLIDDEKRLIFSVLHRGNCDVDYDQKTNTFRSILYTSGTVGLESGKLYHYWTDEEVLDIEVVGGGMKIVGREPNTYSIIPVKPLFDMRKPRTGFWPKTAWDELVRLNEIVNLFHTEVKFNERYQAFGALFTNAKIKGDLVVGPDTVVDLDSNPGEQVFVEYRSPDINLEKFMGWLNELVEAVADNWGVNLKTSGDGSADSGFKLIVEEIWSLETRNKRLRAAMNFERDVYEVVLAISEAHSLKLPRNTKLKADFPEPSLPVNSLEEWQIAREKIGLGVMSKEEYWKKDNPDLTDEDIADKKAKIAADSRGNVPAFAGVADDTIT